MDATGISDSTFSSLLLQDLCPKIDPTGPDRLLLFFVLNAMFAAKLTQGVSVV